MKEQTPVFSIIIPVYNTVKELRRCVESILSQNFDSYEIILVDDGSKDGSGELCDLLAQENQHVICIHKENGGCSEARNTGIRSAKGDYLLFVDSDDMWDDNDALADLNKIILSNDNVDVICFGVAIYSENGKFEKERIPEVTESEKQNKEGVLRELVFANQYFSTSYVKALRRDYFIDNDLFFVKGLLSEDIEWSARVIINCRNIAVYPKAFYKRIRREEGSITASIGRKNILDILNSIESGLVYAREHSENEAMLDLYLEYWAYQYAMLLGLAQVMKTDEEYKSVVERLKKLKWLLKYDHVKKVKAVKLAVSVLGISGTMKLMDKYYSMK